MLRAAMAVPDPYVSRLIPMKRELKDGVFHTQTRFPPSFKTDPDEKGTESRFYRGRGVRWRNVSRLIPMKRELKARIFKIRSR